MIGPTRLLPALAVLAGCASHRPPASPPAPAGEPRGTEAVQARPCPPPPPPPRCPPPADPRLHRLPARIDTALWLSLDSLVEVDYTSFGGSIGACAIRVGDTVPLWSVSPDTRMLPASTQKIFTAAAAMSELGPDFRWRTSLWMTGSVQDSTLRGDLLLEGGGDPTLGGADGNALGGLAAAVRRAGIRRIHGNLVAIDTLVGRGPDAWPGGWTVGSSKDGYGAPVTGLNWNQNRIGDRSVAEPRPLALKALRKALLGRGIQVTGSDTSVRARGDSIGPRRGWTRLGAVSSPELEPVARACLRESVNPYAEGMLLALGTGRRGAPRDAGRRRLVEWLVSRGVDPSRMIVDDGCGLSRYDLATARQMARLLARDVRSPAPRLFDLLPRGGEGTLRHRVALFPDRSVLAAKTGTLDGVSNLAGYLVRPGRDTVAFAILCAGYAGSAGPVRRMQDRLLYLLAGLAPRMPVAPDTADSSATDSTTIPKAAIPASVPATPPPPAPPATSAPQPAATPRPAGPQPAPSTPDSARNAGPGTSAPPPSPVDSLPPGWEDGRP